MEFAEILKYAQKVPILVFGIGIRLNLSVLELLELFEKKKVCKSSNRARFKKPQKCDRFYDDQTPEFRQKCDS